MATTTLYPLLKLNKYYNYHMAASRKSSKTKSTFNKASDTVVSTSKDLWKAGFARTLIVKDQSGDKILALPLTIAIIGAVLAPPVAIIGVFVALLTQCTLTVEKK